MEHMRMQVWAWRCEVVGCGHTWLAQDVIAPPQCSRCKSRKWHTKQEAPVRFEEKLSSFVPVEEVPFIYPGVTDPSPLVVERSQVTPLSELTAKYGLAPASSLLTDPEAAKPKVNVAAVEPAEIPICGHKWWEDGERYECLMDAGHKNPKHGQKGLIHLITD
jgi:hypothetical protein